MLKAVVAKLETNKWYTETCETTFANIVLSMPVHPNSDAMKKLKDEACKNRDSENQPPVGGGIHKVWDDILSGSPEIVVYSQCIGSQHDLNMHDDQHLLKYEKSPPCINEKVGARAIGPVFDLPISVSRNCMHNLVSASINRTYKSKGLTTRECEYEMRNIGRHIRTMYVKDEEMDAMDDYQLFERALENLLTSSKNATQKRNISERLIKEIATKLKLTSYVTAHIKQEIEPWVLFPNPRRIAPRLDYLRTLVEPIARAISK